MPGGRKCEHGARARDCRRCSSNLCHHGKVHRWCALCKPRKISKISYAITKPAGRAPPHSVWLNNFGYFTSPQLIEAKSVAGTSHSHAARPENLAMEYDFSQNQMCIPPPPVPECLKCSALRCQQSDDYQTSTSECDTEDYSRCDSCEDSRYPVDRDASMALLSLHAGDALFAPASPCI